MAGPEEPTKPAPQPQEGAPTPARKRRRRRRPRGRGTAKRTSGSAADPSGGGSTTSSSGRTPGAAKRKRAKRESKSSGTNPRKKPSDGNRRKKPTGKAKQKSAAKRAGKPRDAKIPTTREISAGGVLYRRTDDGDIEVVLASRRTRRGQLAWGLAKGGIELGESRRAAAIREVREETGLIGVIEEDLGDTRYMYVWDDIRIRKTVHFFLMRWTGGDVEDRDDEMEEIRWFPLDRAIKRSAYRGERDMLIKASELLR